MRAVLGVSFIVLFAWVSALAIPRTAGTEYLIRVAWAAQRDAMATTMSRDVTAFSAYRGRNSIVFLDDEDWHNHWRVSRQELALASPDAFLNQGSQEETFAFQVNRPAGSAQSGTQRLPAQGIPRLYQSVAVRFETHEVFLQRIPGNRVLQVPNETSLTAFHAAPLSHNPEGIVVIKGDMFGNVRGIAQDDQFGTPREFLLPPVAIESTIPAIYTVHILSANRETVDFFVVRGFEESRIEFYRWYREYADELTMHLLHQQDIPTDHNMRSAAPAQSVSSRWVAMGMRDGIYLYDQQQGGVIQRLPHTPEWAAMGVGVGEIHWAGSFGRGDVQLGLFEDVQSELSSRGNWIFPGAYPLSGDDRGFLLERGDWYIALEVLR